MDSNNLSNLNILYDYIRDNELLSEEEINIIKFSTNEISELSPTDKPLILRKMDCLIDTSQKLSWVIYSISTKLNKKKRLYKELKDPNYVMLVRQGRPSAAAIDSEIRFSNSDLYSLEEYMDNVNNILDYINHLQLSIERYLYMLKDKLKYN